MENLSLYIAIFIVAIIKFFIQKSTKLIPEAIIISFLGVLIILFVWEFGEIFY